MNPSRIADRANELRRQGKSIIKLVVGEPDFDTPKHIRQAAAEAMEKGATRYTLMAGTVELRQAIAAKLERENGLRYALNEIIATNGAKSAIYNAFAITLEPGDEVIIPAPYWVSYLDMVLACDGTPVTLACSESAGFKLQPAPRGGVMSDMTLVAVTRRIGVDAVPHGFRSTFRDWCSERTNYPREVAEMALAHTIGDKVEAAYRRGDLFEKRRLMMDEWAKFLSRPEVATGKVISMHKVA